MGRRLREEEVMTIEVLHERGCSNREIARTLGVRENAVRYRRARLASGASDGRSDKRFRAEELEAVIGHWLERSGERRGVNLQTLHEHLVAEHGPVWGVVPLTSSVLDRIALSDVAQERS
jgi:IS30 family transposase